MASKLDTFCAYAKGKIAVKRLNAQTYISTENMMPNKGGIVDASSLPSVQYTQQYLKGDVLVSNIRPYFKKIWIAEYDGGCSNDVLVFRANSSCDPTFLYYVLANDAFFDYATATSKGTKMPRGDKTAIMQYDVPDFDMGTQLRIGKLLRSLDDRITTSKRINDNLEQQAFSLFDRLIEETGDSVCMVSEIAYLNPKRSLSKNTIARYIDMSQLSTSGAFPSGWELKPFSGGMRFTNGDTLLARITPCLENGKTAYINFLDDGEIAFGSTEYIVLAPKAGIPPEYLYCLARYPSFVEYAIKNMNGSSGRQRVSADTIGQFVMPRPNDSAMKTFENIVSVMFSQMKNNSLENIKLASLRDSLLPKLMSGEIDVSDIQL